jgi:hypothetical protein
VTFSYDTEAPDRARSVQTKAINVSDFPPARPGRVTRFLEGRTFLRGLGQAVPSSVASDLGEAALSQVDSHFVEAMTRASNDAAGYFLPGRQMVLDAALDDLAAAAADVIEGRHYTLKRPTDENLTDVIAFYDALTDLIGEFQRFQAEARPIVADLHQRAQVLGAVAQSAEGAFVWINTHVPVLFAYYQSFTLWHVRGLFLDMSQRMHALQRFVQARVDEYKAFEDSLTKRLEELRSTMLGDPRRFAEELHKRGAGRRL